MTEAETILKMIEEVSPDDTAKLDEIDARVLCFLMKWNPEIPLHDDRYTNSFPFWQGPTVKEGVKPYTRSRDALKAIRPDGMSIRLWSEHGDSFCCVNERTTGECKTPLYPYLKTEELAELHAIIQAIDYERTHETA